MKFSLDILNGFISRTSRKVLLLAIVSLSSFLLVRLREPTVLRPKDLDMDVGWMWTHQAKVAKPYEAGAYGKAPEKEEIVAQNCFIR